MQEKKTLTFVVPAYNMTEYLERCVMSLIAAKRNDDIEVLIVDDGSSDGTLEMAQKFETRYPGIVAAPSTRRTRVTAGPSTPASAAASGMYVKVVDADGWLARIARTSHGRAARRGRFHRADRHARHQLCV